MGLEDKQAKTLETQRGLANQLATTLLVRSQMLMPRQRWVQPTLAIARASALIATALWSHTDDAALALMAKHLQDEDSLPMPKLSLDATAEAKTTSEIVAGTTMNATVKLTRQHAATPGEGERPACNNEQGICTRTRSRPAPGVRTETRARPCLAPPAPPGFLLHALVALGLACSAVCDR